MLKLEKPSLVQSPGIVFCQFPLAVLLALKDKIGGGCCSGFMLTGNIVVKFPKSTGTCKPCENWNPSNGSRRTIRNETKAKPVDSTNNLYGATTTIVSLTVRIPSSCTSDNAEYAEKTTRPTPEYTAMIPRQIAHIVGSKLLNVISSGSM